MYPLHIGRSVRGELLSDYQAKRERERRKTAADNLEARELELEKRERDIARRERELTAKERPANAMAEQQRPAAEPEAAPHAHAIDATGSVVANPRRWPTRSFALVKNLATEPTPTTRCRRMPQPGQFAWPPPRPEARSSSRRRSRAAKKKSLRRQSSQQAAARATRRPPNGRSCAHR